MSSRSIAAAATVAFACAWVQPATATVYSKVLSQTIAFSQSFSTTSQYTGSTGNTIVLGAGPLFSFTKFNPVGSKGQALTLTGIRISASRALTGTINLVNGSGNARTGTVQFELNSILTSGTLFSLTDQAGSAAIGFNIPKGSQGNLGLANVNTAATNSFSPTSFTPYVGTGTIPVSHSISNFISSVVFTNGGSGNLSGTASGTVAGTFEIEYLYDDPVPEPASWAMLIIGFGLTGAVLRRQRAPRQA